MKIKAQIKVMLEELLMLKELEQKGNNEDVEIKCGLLKELLLKLLSIEAVVYHDDLENFKLFLNEEISTLEDKENERKRLEELEGVVALLILPEVYCED